MEWIADPYLWAFRLEEHSAGPIIVSERLGMRERQRRRESSGLLFRFLSLADSQGNRCLRFLKQFGPWQDPLEPIPVAELTEIAAVTRSLLQASLALRRGQAVVVADRARLLSAALQSGQEAPRRAPSTGRQTLSIDLRPYLPAARWQIDPDDPDQSVPAFSLGVRLPPSSEYPHWYAIPREVDRAGPDAVAAWLSGQAHWKGSLAADSSSPADDIHLIQDCFEATWAKEIPAARLRWDAGETRFTWSRMAIDVVQAIAIEVASRLVGGDYAFCSRCGSSFSAGARGRPRSECDTCYDPNTSRRRAARKSAKKRRLKS